MGLSASLPGGLVVVLRKLGKKDEVTRRRALEDLVSWLSRVKKEGEETLEQTLVQTEGESEEEEIEGADGWWIDVIGPVWVSLIFH